MKRAEKMQAQQELIRAALVGYQRQLDDISGQMAEISRQLTGGKANRVAKPGKKKRRRMSAKGRASIAAAQRARWAKSKAKKGKQTSAKSPKKRVISAAHKQAITDAAKKRREAKTAPVTAHTVIEIPAVDGAESLEAKRA